MAEKGVRMNFDWKNIVRTVAPAIGTALGGPLAGIAIKAIGEKFLGNPNASEQDVANYINQATPEQLVQLKELDMMFYQLEVEDRKSARERETNLAKSGFRDYTPSILAYLSLLFLVFVTIYFSTDGWKEGEINIWFNIATLVTIAFTYYFGDSDRNKNNHGNSR